MICNSEDLVFQWYENVNTCSPYFDSSIFHSIFKTDPLKDFNGYYIHQMTIRFYMILRCLCLGIIKRRYL